MSDSLPPDPTQRLGLPPAEASEPPPPSSPEVLAQVLSQETPAQKAVGWLFAIASLLQLAFAFWPTAGKSWWIMGGGSFLTLVLWIGVGVQRTILPLWLLIGIFLYGLGQSFHVWFGVRLWLSFLLALVETIGLTAIFLVLNLLAGGHTKFARKNEAPPPPASGDLR